MPDRTIIYTSGVFDMLHPGHLAILRRARALGEQLVVGVQEDASVEAQKGMRPIMSTRERTTMLRALPFVDDVITYSNIDQRPILRRLSPHVMVQGGDWYRTGDRSKIVDYARRHGIRIVVLPYTKGVSSTAIKERVFHSLNEARRDKQLEYDLATRLALVPLPRLSTYEASDPERTARVAKRITAIGALLDPLVVADLGGGRLLVVDGTNRLEALRHLGAEWAPVQRVRYFDARDIQLRGNEHYVDGDAAQFLAFVEQSGVPLATHASPRRGHRYGAKNLALIYADGVARSLPTSGEWKNDVERLNALVRSYKGRIPFRRKSEVGNLIGDASVLVRFRPFSPSEMIVLVSQGVTLETGITWHIPESTVIRFEVPLTQLKKGFDSPSEADRFMRDLIAARQAHHSVRRYWSNIYICDEWE